jgi:hypothetical protein
MDLTRENAEVKSVIEPKADHLVIRKYISIQKLKYAMLCCLGGCNEPLQAF